jgi:hypothetical protein
MLEKFEKDGLFFQKIGLLLGTVAGLLVGFMVSDRADKFEIEVIKEEEVSIDGPEKV